MGLILSGTKRVFKLFYIFELGKEENWLRQMANKGWFFQKVNYLGIYTFIKGPCKDIIYKIDFNKNIEDIKEYYDLFSQSGWKYIYQMRFFKYFRYEGDVDNYPDIYNEPSEQLYWLRITLKFFLITYGIEFVSLYSLIFLQSANYSNFNWIIKIIFVFIVLLSYILVRFINSYILLLRRVKEKQYKDYYKNNYLKKACSIISLLIFPIIICGILAITLTFLYTVGGTQNDVKTKVLQIDSSSLYPMKKINYVIEHDFGNYRVCLYGNNDRIGVIALEKLFLNRYKVVTNFSSQLPADQCIITDNLILGENRYWILYGDDEKKEICKLVLLYKDGAKDKVMRDNFIKKDKYFIVIQKTDKNLKQVKAYNKDNVDVTEKYIR